MLLINLIVAILLERFFPSPFISVVESMSSLLALVREKMDVGEKIPAIISWIGVIAIVALLVWLIWFLLGFIHPILSIIFSIIILYLSLGFSNFINRFNSIQLCLSDGKLVEARQHLLDWAEFVGADPVVFSTAKSGDSSAITRETIRLAILAAQRNLFGVVFWYLILPGPIGPIVYRVSLQAMKDWNKTNETQVEVVADEESISSREDSSRKAEESPDPKPEDFFSETAKRGFFWVDWVSCRVTAFVFAIVGNFEDTVQMIRARSSLITKQVYDSERIILSAGEGALTMRLTIPIASSESQDYENLRSVNYNQTPELKEVDENSLKVVEGLIWRSLFLWIFFLVLITLGYLSNLIV